MSADSRSDFLHWLRSELEREELEAALRGTPIAAGQPICLSELEATALLILALNAEGDLGIDTATADLAHQMAYALQHRLEAAGLDSDDVPGSAGRPGWPGYPPDDKGEQT